MSMRTGLRAFMRNSPFLRQPPTLQCAQRRSASTVESAAETVSQSALTRFWNSPTGPKTVHFWAPVMKWGVVISGAADFARPASQLSITQNAALMATGAIWTRWCFVIKPRNVLLASVNFLLFCVGAAQVTRAVIYQQSIKGETAGQEAKEVVKEEGSVVDGIVQNPKKALNNIVNPK